MVYTIPIKSPDLAYRDTWLWVPKKLVNHRMLKRSLTIKTAGEELELWRETEHHIGVPRARLTDEEVKCEIVDLTPKEYQPVGIRSLITLDAMAPNLTRQRDAYEDMMDARGGILNLACGLGKTVVILHALAEWKVPALIITHQTHVLYQWKDEIFGVEEENEPAKLEVDGELGWIQGKPEKWKWRGCPITMASMRTLSIYRDHIPPEMTSYFGVVVFDEVQHVAAKQLAKTADMFLGRRIGATATVNRPDGSELIYLWHLGWVFHENLEQDLVPEVVFHRSYTELDMSDPHVRRAVTDVTHEEHMLKMNAFVGQLPEEIDIARSLIDEGVEKDLDTLVLSTSVDHIEALGKLYPGAPVLYSKVAAKKRLQLLKKNRLSFATVQLLREAANKKSLENLIVLVEFSSSNTLQQTIGRILRPLPGKQPRVTVVLHTKIPEMKGRGENLKRHFRRWGMEVKEV
jgi:superfamily II DNA or RNA helicase